MKKLKHADQCRACFGTGAAALVDDEEIFVSRKKNPCKACGGLGWLGCVRLRNLRVGSMYAYSGGQVAKLIRRYPDGSSCVELDGIQQSEPRQNLPVRLVSLAPRAAGVAS